MNFRILLVLFIVIISGINSSVSAQADSFVGQITDSTNFESFAGGISGDGRFAVIESRGNIATENPRNDDGNREIFLFDYAQRRIFQITDTKPVRTDTNGTYVSTNIKVEIANVRPTISGDGRWVVFGSNATTSAPNERNGTNPGSFNGENYNVTSGSTTTNVLTSDANLEMWMYQIPSVATADLTSGEEVSFTNLTGGTFIQVTSTAARRAPVAGTSTLLPIISDDNRDVSSSDDGNVIAFVSNRNFPNGQNSDINDEIVTYTRSSNTVKAVTVTGRGTVTAPIFSSAPVLSGAGTRVAFSSNANQPLGTGTVGTNTDRTDEIFIADLTDGAPTANLRQITNTTATTEGDLVNLWSYGKRMSRDGNFLGFDSFADLANENGGANQGNFALYVYDITNPAAPTARRIGPRSNADSAITNGDSLHLPTFTIDRDSNNVAQPVVLFSLRSNIRTDGTVPTTATDGQNSNASRPPQIYKYLLRTTANNATYQRVTTLLPSVTTSNPTIQPLASYTINRAIFSAGLVDASTGNFDYFSEVYYLYSPNAVVERTATFSLRTGASNIPVSATPVPTPTASPSPTPQTPSAVQGVSPGMLAVIDIGTNTGQPSVSRTAVGSLARRFTLPISLSGVSVSINGAAAGIKSVSPTEIAIVVPRGVPGTSAGTSYPLVINNNGTVYRGTVTVVATRPDIFTAAPVQIPTFPLTGARAQIINVTNAPLITREPFTTTTFKRKGSRRVPTVVRLYLTGIEGVPANFLNVRIGSVTINPTLTNAVLVEPGIYSVDFTLPATLANAGNQPIIVSITVNSVVFSSRLDDTAPRVAIF